MCLIWWGPSCCTILWRKAERHESSQGRGGAEPMACGECPTPSITALAPLWEQNPHRITTSSFLFLFSFSLFLFVCLVCFCFDKKSGSSGWLPTPYVAQGWRMTLTSWSSCLNPSSARVSDVFHYSRCVEFWESDTGLWACWVCSLPVEWRHILKAISSFHHDTAHFSRI